MRLINGIHHISMKTCDAAEYDKAIAFYKGVLGLDVVREWNDGIMLDTGSGIVEIFKNADETLKKGVIRHFAFAVDDVKACAKAVSDAGYEVFMGPKEISFPSSTPYSAQVAFCYGPLGEEIEFFQGCASGDCDPGDRPLGHNPLGHDLPYVFDVPDYKKLRVIIDTDAACEADDPFAIVHALLSPKLIVKGITAEHFNKEGSVEKSFDEIETILDAMDMDVLHFMGEEGPLSTLGGKYESPAVDFIISEALSNDSHPLYILCQGAVTNLAAAFRKCPEIVDRINVIWIGTHGEMEAIPYREFNAGNDVEAANVVLSSGVKLSLVPSTVYSTITIGIAELQSEVYPCGKIGKHLFEQLVNYNNSDEAEWTKGESWSLGDSPAVAIALNPWCGHYKEIGSPIINEDTSSTFVSGRPTITMYTDVDSRYILGDMIAKLRLF